MNNRSNDTSVLFLVGDIHHGAVLQEHAWRDVLSDTGWRLRFAQTMRAITPDELAATDMLVVSRYAGGDLLGHSSERLVTRRGERGTFITPEMETLLTKRVREGMGLIATHSSIYNPGSPVFLALLGVEKPHMHGPIVPVSIHKLNQDHPVTRGIEPFDFQPDEAFSAIMLPGPYSPLFNIKQTDPPLDALGGWCREEGKGRVSVLLPGHNSSPYLAGAYRTIMWRTAHWTLGKDIPARTFPDGLACGDDPRSSEIL
jgi:type 1 glutamine amidotransferase